MCLIIRHIRKFIPSYIRHLTSAILRIREPPLSRPLSPEVELTERIVRSVSTHYLLRIRLYA